MTLPLNFPFYKLIKTSYNLNLIFYKEFKVINDDETIPDFYTYILISDKGDIIYISTDEYKLNENNQNNNIIDKNYFIKHRINTDDVTLSTIDFKHVIFTDDNKNSVISKKSLISIVDNIVIEKIRNLFIN
jgi:hypothetical protein